MTMTRRDARQHAIDEIKRDIALITLFGEPADRGRNHAYLTMDVETFEKAITDQIIKDDAHGF